MNQPVEDMPTRITGPFLDVLEVFLDAGGEELHGWMIIRTSNKSGPTVYKILERLAAMEWVTARWDNREAEPNKPRRRYYRLTADGAAKARTILAERRPQSTRTILRPAFGGGAL